MGSGIEQSKRLHERRARVAKQVNLTEMIRGTMLKRYLECVRPNCKCHKSKKYRHGPYYFLSIRRKDKSYHVYIPKEMRTTIEQWVKNYNKVWQGIEKITDINVKLIRSRRK